jgi:hypothetical protein
VSLGRLHKVFVLSAVLMPTLRQVENSLLF